MELNRDQVLALAPDASSAKAATGLLADGKWDTLGADARALWGECKGSGAKPYQVQVELGALASRCSCPSRKFPCKHGLALMLMYAQGNPRFASASAPPDWVTQWLVSRQERSAKKEAAAASPSRSNPRRRFMARPSSPRGRRRAAPDRHPVRDEGHRDFRQGWGAGGDVIKSASGPPGPSWGTSA